MELEQKLADILFSEDPLLALEHQRDPAFLCTSRKQFALFHTLLLKRVEERLSDQFGACLALVREKRGLESDAIAKAFVKSSEYRQVREDLCEETQAQACRFEMAFLHFILRTQEDSPDFLDEFGEIYLRELTMT